MLKLTPIKVQIDELLLDPNNPRLVTDLNIDVRVPDEEFEGRQENLLKKFDGGDSRYGDDDFFGIETLKDSMREIGYVGIDRIVVRTHSSGKYVVLEGNRRTATMKILRAKNNAALANDRLNKLEPHVSETFEELEVMELMTEGLSPSEINENINILLGLRHYGSLLEWDPLPKAYNMYHNYMHIEPKLDEFQVDQKRIKEVASRLSIKQPVVRQALKTYIAYLQLSEHFIGVEEKYYSLIQAAITNKNIAGNGYLVIDEVTYQLDEKSQHKMNQVCQFANRGSMPKDHIIIRDPKKIKLLGDLVKKSRTGPTEAIRDLAEGLLADVESGEVDLETGKLVLDLDAGINALNEFEANSLWVSQISNLLQKQKDELQIKDYKGIGNDLMQKRRVEKNLDLLKRIFAVATL